MSRYAQGTSVTAERSRIEIERMLRRYGCEQFQAGWDSASRTHHVLFRYGGWLVQLVLPMPDPESTEFTVSPAGRTRAAAAAEAAYESEIKRRWRALLLVIKAKLEAVETGISTLQAEFLSQLVLPNGTTFGDWAVPQLTEIAQTQAMPKLIGKAGGR